MQRLENSASALKEALRRIAPVFESKSNGETESSSRSTGRRHTRHSNPLSGSSGRETASQTPVERPSRSRARQHRNRQHDSPPPCALPTPDFYERYPERVGPTGNVVIPTAEEHRLFRLTATRVTVVETHARDASAGLYTREDIALGGFFVYEAVHKEPEYFVLQDTGSVVYGSSTYIQAANPQVKDRSS
ncbi:hypothetical protein NESM_000212600 [Novymonas esmeraldas]|uniref:Uncharacterized protein n=1 Tax=Novymonas esmeraldas TaxID=1808958 RepID=A0AAW0F869_9TRYP